VPAQGEKKRERSEEKDDSVLAVGKRARVAPLARLTGKRRRIDSSGENRSGKRGRGSSTLERWLASGSRKVK
jgi:hypothetical protein